MSSSSSVSNSPDQHPFVRLLFGLDRPAEHQKSFRIQYTQEFGLFRSNVALTYTFHRLSMDDAPTTSGTNTEPMSWQSPVIRGALCIHPYRSPSTEDAWNEFELTLLSKDRVQLRFVAIQGVALTESDSGDTLCYCSREAVPSFTVQHGQSKDDEEAKHLGTEEEEKNDEIVDEKVEETAELRDNEESNQLSSTVVQSWKVTGSRSILLAGFTMNNSIDNLGHVSQFFRTHLEVLLGETVTRTASTAPDLCQVAVQPLLSLRASWVMPLLRTPFLVSDTQNWTVTEAEYAAECERQMEIEQKTVAAFQSAPIESGDTSATSTSIPTPQTLLGLVWKTIATRIAASQSTQ